MACYLLDQCPFYKIHKSNGGRGKEYLLSGYCEGQYNWLCGRKRFFDKTGMIAPGDLDPIGVLPPDLVSAPDFVSAGSYVNSG